MSTTPIPIDIQSISSNKDLVQLAEEVKKTKTPRALTKGDETLAVLMPVEKKTVTQAQPNQKAIEEILSLAGAWGERDWNEVEAELDRIRHESTPTAPIDLDV
jgi:hypothetical protein